ARLTQMKWKGTVAQLSPSRSIHQRLARAKTPQPTSSQLLRSLEAIPDIAHGLDDVGAELRPQAPHADVHHVGAGVEGAAPGFGETPLALQAGAGSVDEPLQHQELTRREGDRAVADVRLAQLDVERQAAGPAQRPALDGPLAQSRADPRDELG